MYPCAPQRRRWAPRRRAGPGGWNAAAAQMKLLFAVPLAPHGTKVPSLLLLSSHGFFSDKCIRKQHWSSQKTLNRAEVGVLCTAWLDPAPLPAAWSQHLPQVGKNRGPHRPPGHTSARHGHFQGHVFKIHKATLGAGGASAAWCGQFRCSWLTRLAHGAKRQLRAAELHVPLNWGLFETETDR